MNAIDSRTIRTIVFAVVAYTLARWAVPAQFDNDMVKHAITDLIVYGGFALAAWYRKHSQGAIKRWWGRQ